MSDTPHLVATERGPRGGHLVFLGQDGAKLADLTLSGSVVVRDNSSTWSPDGRWIAFESSRGRPITDTSLWTIEARVGGKPRRITSTNTNDRHPAWFPRGNSLVFASQPRGGNFDLWRLDLSLGPWGLRGKKKPVPLTQTGENELHPSVSPDGKRIVFMKVSEKTKHSSLWILSLADGRTTQLTKGPMDITPSWSPDGTKIAFAAPAGTRPDYDLFWVAPEGGKRHRIVDEPFADQTGPKWSADGRYLFCTSLYRAHGSGEPLFASVTVLAGMGRPPAVLRALHDPAAVESRLGPAVAPHIFPEGAFHRNPTYEQALKGTIAEQIRIHQDKRAP